MLQRTSPNVSVKGCVRIHRPTGKWIAECRGQKGFKKHVGTYSTEQEAQREADKAAEASNASVKEASIHKAIEKSVENVENFKKYDTVLYPHLDVETTTKFFYDKFIEDVNIAVEALGEKVNIAPRMFKRACNASFAKAFHEKAQRVGLEEAYKKASPFKRDAMDHHTILPEFKRSLFKLKKAVTSDPKDFFNVMLYALEQWGKTGVIGSTALAMTAWMQYKNININTAIVTQMQTNITKQTFGRYVVIKEMFDFLHFEGDVYEQEFRELNKNIKFIKRDSRNCLFDGEKMIKGHKGLDFDNDFPVLYFVDETDYGADTKSLLDRLIHNRPGHYIIYGASATPSDIICEDRNGQRAFKEENIIRVGKPKSDEGYTHWMYGYQFSVLAYKRLAQLAQVGSYKNGEWHPVFVGKKPCPVFLADAMARLLYVGVAPGNKPIGYEGGEFLGTPGNGGTGGFVRMHTNKECDDFSELMTTKYPGIRIVKAYDDHIQGEEVEEYIKREIKDGELYVVLASAGCRRAITIPGEVTIWFSTSNSFSTYSAASQGMRMCGWNKSIPGKRCTLAFFSDDIVHGADATRWSRATPGIHALRKEFAEDPIAFEANNRILELAQPTPKATEEHEQKQTKRFCFVVMSKPHRLNKTFEQILTLKSVTVKGKNINKVSANYNYKGKLPSWLVLKNNQFYINLNDPAVFGGLSKIEKDYGAKLLRPGEVDSVKNQSYVSLPGPGAYVKVSFNNADGSAKNRGAEDRNYFASESKNGYVMCLTFKFVSGKPKLHSMFFITNPTVHKGGQRTLSMTEINMFNGLNLDTPENTA